jgi:hypothetical protein
LGQDQDVGSVVVGPARLRGRSDRSAGAVEIPEFGRMIEYRCRAEYSVVERQVIFCLADEHKPQFIGRFSVER